MKARLWFAGLCGMLFISSLRAGTIQYAVTPLGGNQYSYTYSLSGFSLVQGNEIDIRFDPASYGSLSNGTAGSDFTLLVLQPDNPPGTFGDYSATAKVNNPSLTGPFGVNFTWLGTGTPGSQPYQVNAYDSVLGQQILERGITVPSGAPGVPEPTTFSLALLALLSGAVFARRTRA